MPSSNETPEEKKLRIAQLRRDRAKAWQAFYWYFLDKIGIRIHALIVFLGPLLAFAISAVTIGFIGLFRLLVYNDVGFIDEVIHNRYISLAIVVFVWIWGNLFLSVVIAILVGIPIWGISFFIYSLLFPKLYKEAVLDYEKDEKGIVTVKKTGNMTQKARVFWCDDESFFLYRRVVKLDKAIWWLNRTPYEAYNIDNEVRKSYIVDQNYSVMRFIFGFYTTDWYMETRRCFNAYRSGFFDYVVQGLPGEKRDLNRIVDSTLQPIQQEHDIKQYQEELTKSIEKTGNQMDNVVGLNKFVSTTERIEGVVQKKTTWEIAREESELSDEDNLKRALADMVKARRSRMSRRKDEADPE